MIEELSPMYKCTRKRFELAYSWNKPLTIELRFEAMEGTLLCSALFNSYLQWKFFIKKLA
jgi:hypothetical protein